MVNEFINLDLLSVGIAAAGIAVLGFIVYYNDRKSITNKTFLFFSLISIIWGVFNYFTYNIKTTEVAFWLQRLVIFLAVWQAFFIFQFFYVFPNKQATFNKKYKYVLFPITLFAAILTLTPLVFKRVAEVSSGGMILKIENGPGIAIFGLVAVGLVLGSFFFLIKRFTKSREIERTQLKYISLGAVLMFALIIIFNFILPAFFNDARYISLGAVFTFPFVVFTAYAIFKHHLLNVKIITTEILAFVLAVVSLIDVILSSDITTIILRSGIFLLVLSFGILLIRSVLKEVEQRERLEKLTKSLEEANEKLKDLDKLKSQFLSFASHQVKAPMNVVKGYATLIYDGTYGPVSEKIKDTAVKIKDSADRMIALVNNIMDLRKIEEGVMEYKFEEANIGDMVADVVGEFRMLAENKKLQFEFTKPEKILMANVDVQKVRQSIQNLVENAIKYTDTGWIKVEIGEFQYNQILISVTDTGHGIALELLPKLFEQYQRDSATASKIEGTGLGLFIAKQIILANHGDIWAESEGTGKGSKFCIKLPRSL
ncbi:MAG: ATP-binding protein [Minisyncoccia bacterium]|jgi:signal transduction histidine kinase